MEFSAVITSEGFKSRFTRKKWLKEKKNSYILLSFLGSSSSFGSFGRSSNFGNTQWTGMSCQVNTEASSNNMQFVMSTLNSSRTGQGVVHLSRDFFRNYALLRRGSPDTILRCNVSNKVKHVLTSNQSKLQLTRLNIELLQHH